MQRRPDTSEHPHAQAHSYLSAHAASDDACGNTYVSAGGNTYADANPDTNAYTDADSYPGAYHNVQLWQRSHLRI